MPTKLSWLFILNNLIENIRTTSLMNYKACIFFLLFNDFKPRKNTIANKTFKQARIVRCLRDL